MHKSIFAMITYGKGGWTHSDLYNMPIFLRNFYFKELVKALERENEPEQSVPTGPTNVPMVVQKQFNKQTTKKK